MSEKLKSNLRCAILCACSVALGARSLAAGDETLQPGQSTTSEDPPPPATESSTGSQIRCEPAKGGFLLLGKTSIVPPYDIKYEGLLCDIAGCQIDLGSIVYPGRGGKRGDKAAANAARRLVQQLERGRSLVQFSDHSAVLLDRETDTYYLLKAIISISSGVKPEDVDLTRLAFFRPIETWRSWLRDFEPTREFLDRAKAEIAAIDEVEASNLEANKAARQQGRPLFLLLVSGMVVCVLAIGHLLSHHPARESASATPEAMRAFVLSLLLIAALAAFDVAWTVLWTPTGDVIELNPLGSHLIPDARELVVFKCLATLMTVGILVVLRHHRLARLAAWWSCLVLALVAMRWLTINSIFT